MSHLDLPRTAEERRQCWQRVKAVAGFVVLGAVSVYFVGEILYWLVTGADR